MKKKLYQFSSKYGWWGTPNFDDNSYSPDYDRKFRVLHDEFGNRCTAEHKPTSVEKSTFVFLGGSHTWGAGVENFETFPAIFENLVDLPVANLGHCSFGLDQLLLVLTDLSNQAKLNCVYVELHPWVIHRVLRKSSLGFPKPYFEVSGDGLKLQKLKPLQKNRITRQIVADYWAFQKSYEEYRGNIQLQSLEKEFMEDPIFMIWKQQYYVKMYNLIQRLFELFLAFSKEKKIEIRFILGPTKQELSYQNVGNLLIDPSLPRRMIRHKLDTLGINYFDFLPEFETLRAEEDAGMYSDGHINLKGHRLLGTKLYESLKD